MAQLKTPTPPVSKTVQRLLAQIHATTGCAIALAERIEPVDELAEAA